MVHLQTLGAAAIRIGSTRLGPSSARAFSALLFLAVERGRRVSRNTLHSLLFPASTDPNGLHSVRQLLYKLRQVGAPLEGDNDSVILPVNAVQDDYSPLIAGDAISLEDLDRLAGGFLPGYAPDFSEAYTEWLEQYRASVTLGIRRQLIEELARLRRLGKWDRASRVARACLALDPLNEEATLALAEMLALSGSKTEAVRLLDHYLAEIGGDPAELRIPVAVLRRRIAERFPEPSYRSVPQGPLIGRDDEMATLARHFEATRQGRLQTVLVSGDPGIGKSRLVAEFAKVAVVQGAVVRTVAAQPHDKRRPLSVFMDVTPVLRALPGALGCAPESLQLLGNLVAVETPAAEKSSGNPPSVFANATRALSDLLDAVSSEAPLVIVFEDAQWMDQLSLITLADLTAERQDRPVLFILTSREPRLLADAPMEIRGSHLPLSPLGEAHATELLREFLGGTPAERDTDLQTWCVRTAGGNPFFLHALANHHVATGERFSVPASLTELLTRRLERLDRRTATVFDACVLLGKHSTIVRLDQVLGVPALELAESLRVLEEGGFVVAEGGHLRSAHYLLSDVAAERMPTSVATLLHARVAEVLTSAEEDDQDASALWDAAEHWYRAGEREHAVAVLEARAARAMAISQPQQAVEMYQRASEIAVGTRRTTLLRRLVDAAYQATDFATFDAALEQFRTLDGQSSADTASHNALELMKITADRMAGADRILIRDSLTRCLLCTTATPEHRLRAARQLMGVSDELLRLDEMENVYRVAREIPHNDSLAEDAMMLDLLYCATFGERSTTETLAREFLAREAACVPPSLVKLANCFNATLALYRIGEVDEAERHLERLYGRAVTLGDPFSVHWIAAARTMIMIDRGDMGGSRHWHEIASSAECRTHFRHLPSGHVSNGIRIAMHEGRVADGRALLERVLRDCPALRAGRYYRVAASYRIRLRQLAGELPQEDEDLPGLLESHEQACRVGMQDDVTAVIWHALVERGESATANALLDSYLTHMRRDGYPPAYEIQVILSSRETLDAKLASQLHH